MFIKCPECNGEVIEGSQLCPLCGGILAPRDGGFGAGSEADAGGPVQNSALAEITAPPPKKSAFHKSGQSGASNYYADPGYEGGQYGAPGKLDPSIRRRSLTGNAIGFILFFMLGAPFYNLVRPYIRYDYEGIYRFF